MLASMKKILATLILTLALAVACQAQEVTLSGYWTGAWYETVVPKTFSRSAGQIDIYQWSDKTVEVDLWYDGYVVATGVGVWNVTATGRFTVSFTLDDGSYFVGGGKSFFWSGTLKQLLAAGKISGKWQAN